MRVVKRVALKNIQIYKSPRRLVRSDSKRFEQQIKRN